MSAAPKSNVVRINDALRKAGREERLVRGRGYYYILGGDACRLPASSIYSYDVNAWEFQSLANEVAALLAPAGIVVDFGAGK